uniref:Tudor domain-containing protein n=1 Tax=Panagrolaimus sp. ES5 TaxID=591445 RepID=A0AC34FSF5_9BILA
MKELKRFDDEIDIDYSTSITSQKLAEFPPFTNLQIFNLHNISDNFKASHFIEFIKLDGYFKASITSSNVTKSLDIHVADISRSLLGLDFCKDFDIVLQACSSDSVLIPSTSVRSAVRPESYAAAVESNASSAGTTTTTTTATIAYGLHSPSSVSSSTPSTVTSNGARRSRDTSPSTSTWSQFCPGDVVKWYDSKNELWSVGRITKVFSDTYAVQHGQSHSVIAKSEILRELYTTACLLPCDPDAAPTSGNETPLASSNSTTTRRSFKHPHASPSMKKKKKSYL